jgi:hypothetical protein
MQVADGDDVGHFRITWIAPKYLFSMECCWWILCRGVHFVHIAHSGTSIGTECVEQSHFEKRSAVWF